MADRPSPPSELVYLPGPSWAPLLLAVGLAVALAGSFAGWVYAVIGGTMALIAIGLWVKKTSSDLAALPAEQTVDTAVLPPGSVRQANAD